MGLVIALRDWLDYHNWRKFSTYQLPPRCQLHSGFRWLLDFGFWFGQQVLYPFWIVLMFVVAVVFSAAMVISEDSVADQSAVMSGRILRILS